MLCTCHGAGPHRVVRNTSAEGISKVELRAWRAGSAKVIVESRADIQVSGQPAIAANGFHDPDPGEHETKPDEMPLDFNFARYGSISVIASNGEVTFPHHHYFLDALEVRVPEGVEVLRERRTLSKPPKVAKADIRDAGERREEPTRLAMSLRARFIRRSVQAE